MISFADRVTIALLVFALTTAMGLPAVAVVTRGQSLGVTDALVFGSIGLVIFVVLSSWTALLATERVRRIAAKAWLFVCCIVLLFSEYTHSLEVANSDKAADTFLIYAMLGLTFPGGVASLLLMAAYGWIFSRGVTRADIFIIWLIFFVVGFAQWDYIVPRLRRRWMSS